MVGTLHFTILRPSLAGPCLRPENSPCHASCWPMIISKPYQVCGVHRTQKILSRECQTHLCNCCSPRRVSSLRPVGHSLQQPIMAAAPRTKQEYNGNQKCADRCCCHEDRSAGFKKCPCPAGAGFSIREGDIIPPAAQPQILGLSVAQGQGSRNTYRM